MPIYVGGVTGTKNKGAYGPAVTYQTGDTVQYGGATYQALVSSLTGVTPVDGASWKLLVPRGAGVPAGGTTGQVLAKTSGSDYATGWTSVSPTSTYAAMSLADPVMASGQWYDNRAYAYQAGNSYSLAVTTVYYHPVVLSAGASITGFGCVSQGGTTVRFGFSAADATTYQPGTLLYTGSLASPTAGQTYTTTFAAVSVPSFFYISIGNTSATTAYTYSGMNAANRLLPRPGGAPLTSAGGGCYSSTTSAGIPVSNPTSLGVPSLFFLLFFKIA